jgi:tripartite-type tricarboxylate transporter receptor subunit TctC
LDHDCRASSGTLRVALVAATIALIPQASVGFAQAYPVKLIRFIDPFAPGGPTDILARLMGPKLADAWGQPVIVENRPGGGTVIGTELVARSAPDGYTLLMVATSHATNPSLRKLPFDTLRDLAPVMLVGTSANVLVAHPSLPAKSVKELMAITRSRPGQVAYASGGNGTSTHLSGELFAQMVGVKMIHVPYKGGGPAVVALLSGEVSWMFSPLVAAMPHIQTGRVRPLAVTSSRRASILPAVPAVGETLAGFDAPAWYGISTPGGTPKDVIAKVNLEMARVLNAPDIRERLAREGVDIVAGSPEEFGAFFRKEIEKWAKVIRAADIRLE